MKFLSDLQSDLFEMMTRLKSSNLKGNNLKEEIQRAIAFNELAKTAVANGSLMAKCVDTLYGIPVSEELPLIQKSEGDKFIAGKKPLIRIPRDDGTGGFKRSKQNFS